MTADTVVSDIDLASNRVRELVAENAQLRADIKALRDDRDAYRARVQADVDALTKKFEGIDLAQLRTSVAALENAFEDEP